MQEPPEYGCVDGLIQVRIVEDDKWAVAAERGTGCKTNASPISDPAPTITLKTPGGRPASSKIFPKSEPPVIGVSLAGFNTTALPTASAGPTERALNSNGHFKD
jgi:hypothetical protein